MKATARDRRLLMQYGITEEELKIVLKFQGGVCAICSRPPVKIRLNADHDHKTGVLRGFICMTCNKGLAMFRDHPLNLEAAVAYLFAYPAASALGYFPMGRTGRSGRKWRTKREKRERLAWVERRLTDLGYSSSRRRRDG